MGKYLVKEKFPIYHTFHKTKTGCSTMGCCTWEAIVAKITHVAMSRGVGIPLTEEDDFLRMSSICVVKSVPVGRVSC
jgi:hypothetical protein